MSLFPKHIIMILARLVVTYSTSEHSTSELLVCEPFHVGNTTSKVPTNTLSGVFTCQHKGRVGPIGVHRSPDVQYRPIR